MADKKSGKKTVCLRDRLLAEREAIRQREAQIADELKAMDKDEMEKWINARVREDRVLAKQANPSRIISETHQEQLKKIWAAIFRHDLEPGMVAKAVEHSKQRRRSKELSIILSEEPNPAQEVYDAQDKEARDADKTFGGETLRDILKD